MSFVPAKIQQNCTSTGKYNSKATRQGIICGYTVVHGDKSYPWLVGIVNAHENQLKSTTDKETDVSWDIFITWKIDSGLWAGLECEKKRVLADYEQFLRAVSLSFHG